MKTNSLFLILVAVLIAPFRSYAMGSKAPSLANMNSEDDVYSLYAELRTIGDLVWDSELGAYLALSHQATSDVLNRSDDFDTSPLDARAEPVMGGRVLAQMSGHEHKAKARTVSRALSKVSQNFPGQVQALALEIMGRWEKEGKTSVDLVHDFGREIGIRATLALLDLPQADFQRIFAWHKGIVHFITSLKSSPEEKANDLQCGYELGEYLKGIIDQKRQSPQARDVISALLYPEGGNIPLTDTEVIALVKNILLAATEPADKSFARMMRHLLASSGPISDTTLSAYFSEALRLFPPVQLIPRAAKHDTVLSNTLIPQGSVVYAVIGSANRDESAFESPCEFKPSRWDTKNSNPHLSFGFGLHRCIGSALSKIEIRTLVETFLAKYPKAQLLDGQDFRESGIYTRGLSHLWVNLEEKAEAVRLEQQTNGENNESK